MNYGLYVSAAGADTQSRRMEVLSHNLANVDTPGFKEQLAIVQARFSRAIQDGKDVPGSGSLNDLSSGVSVVESMTNYAPGPVRSTGRNLDMAIQGDGFFVVDQGGQQMLTRAGNFQLDPTGRLTTADGNSVLSADGSPIRVNPSLPWVLQQDGFLSQAGGGVFIGLAKPASTADLDRAGENLFRPRGPLQAVPVDQRRVVQGHLETSAVRPARAMMDMIETSRAYETNIRMIQNQDQLTGSLVNRILRQK